MRPGSDVSYLFQGGKLKFNAIFGGAAYRYSRNIARIEDVRGDDVFGVFWANTPDENRDRIVNGVVLY
jgi:hypothetical protein